MLSNKIVLSANLSCLGDLTSFVGPTPSSASLIVARRNLMMSKFWFNARASKFFSLFLPLTKALKQAIQLK